LRNSRRAHNRPRLRAIPKSHCIPDNLAYRLSPVERSIGLAFTTLTIFAPLAHAARQNSVALLKERRGAGATGRADQDPTGSGTTGGCSAAGGPPWAATALALLGVVRRRRRR
jgi:uncharacterized protein (TIGR03382 family)